MAGRFFIFLGLCLYAIVLGCVVLPTAGQVTAGDSPGARGSTSPGGLPTIRGSSDLPFRSITIQIQRTDWMDQYEKCIDEVAAVGADTVMFVVDARQENQTSTRIYLDIRMTPTAEALGKLIDHAKGKNLRVILMPIVLLDKDDSGAWRGTIKPTQWEDWFESYTNMIMHFAYLAQDHRVDMLVVGSELNSTVGKTEEWRKIIRKVRKSFTGRLTYSSNWDFYTQCHFWDELDLVSMNSYWSLDNGKKSKCTVADIQEAWHKIQKDVLTFCAEQRKPLMFLEIGWFSLSNSADEPWDYTKEYLAVDVDLQKRLYEGFFSSWYGNPGLGGFSVWCWTPGDGGTSDKGYTPENKPAEKVLRDYLAKPAWKVGG